MKETIKSIRQAFFAVKDQLFTKGFAGRWLIMAVLFSLVLLDSRLYTHGFFKCCSSRWSAYGIVALFIFIDRVFEFTFVRYMGDRKLSIRGTLLKYIKPSLFMTLLDIFYFAFMYFFKIFFIYLKTHYITEGSITAFAIHGAEFILMYLVLILLVIIRWNVFMLLIKKKGECLKKVRESFSILQDHVGKYIITGIVFLAGWLITGGLDRLLAKYIFSISFNFGNSGEVLTTVGQLIGSNSMRVVILIPFYLFLYYFFMFFFYNITEYPDSEKMPYIHGFFTS